MKKAALAVLLLGTALCIPGCGFEEGAGQALQLYRQPRPLFQHQPLRQLLHQKLLPTPEPVVEQTASGVNVTKQDGTYVANADINLRADASADATSITGVTSGTQLTSTGVCDNGWIEVSYEGQTAYVSGDYVSAVAADGAAADGTCCIRQLQKEVQMLQLMRLSQADRLEI